MTDGIERGGKGGGGCIAGNGGGSFASVGCEPGYCSNYFDEGDDPGNCEGDNSTTALQNRMALFWALFGPV